MTMSTSTAKIFFKCVTSCEVYIYNLISLSFVLRLTPLRVSPAMSETPGPQEKKNDFHSVTI